MSAISATPIELPTETRDFYVRALQAMNKASAPYLVGGAYAFERYTGIPRHTKDFDIFVRESDLAAVLAVLEESGFETEQTFPHWLAKAYNGQDFVDVIFGAGNGVAVVDELWFEFAVEARVFDVPVKLIPVEEMIWSKAFIMERERYDGADIAHLLKARAEQLNWPRLLARFGPHWRVLLVHLILFGFIYPSERTRVPRRVMEALIRKIEPELTTNDRRHLCQGTLISRAQFLIDVGVWGYQDARLLPRGTMTAEDIAQWTAAINREK
jgi:hypothetical protein